MKTQFEKGTNMNLPELNEKGKPEHLLRQRNRNKEGHVFWESWAVWYKNTSRPQVTVEQLIQGLLLPVPSKL